MMLLSRYKNNIYNLLVIGLLLFNFSPGQYNRQGFVIIRLMFIDF